MEMPLQTSTRVRMHTKWHILGGINSAFKIAMLYPRSRKETPKTSLHGYCSIEWWDISTLFIDI